MKGYLLALCVLAVWRASHLLAAEDGPGAIVARLRRALGEGRAGAALDCFNCTSLWVAAPFAAWLGETGGERLLLWPALSGAAILLQRATTRAPAPYWTEETPDVMLREEKDGDA